MAIVKSKHASNYTVIPNAIFKQSLTIEAVGLLTYLLSLPHDWVVYKTTLHTAFEGMGAKKMDRVFKELQTKGYIMSAMRHEKGRLTHEHIVYDIPFNGEQPPPNVGVEKQGVVSVGVREQGVVKDELLSTNTQNTNITKEIATNNIKIGSAGFFDITAYINTVEGKTIYTTVTAKLKNRGITEGEFLAFITDRYAFKEFADANHVYHALDGCIKLIEANKKKDKGRDKPKGPMDGMVL